MKKLLIILFTLCFVIIISFGSEAGSNINLEIDVGFEQGFTDNNWLPVGINVENKGQDFTGEIEIVLKNQNIFVDGLNERKYRIPLTISADSTREHELVVFYVSGYYAPINIRLLKENEQQPVKEEEFFLQNITLDYPGVLEVSEFKPERKRETRGERRSQKILYLNPELLPGEWNIYFGLNIIIFKEIDLTELSRSQLEAIRNWFLKGNNIILTGRNHLESNFNFLVNILPDNYYQIRQYYDETDYEEFLRGDFVLFSAGDDISDLNYIMGDNSPLEIKYGFLDGFTDEMYTEVIYWLPSPIRILALFLILIILLLFIYQNGNSRDWPLRLYVLSILLLVILFTAYIHYSIGIDLKGKNQVVQETAIINKLSSNQIGTVESYFTFLNRKRDDQINFNINRNSGTITDFTPFYRYDLNQSSYINITGNQVQAIYNDINHWFPGGFRAHYLTNLPVFLEKKEHISDNNTVLQLRNETRYIIEKMYILYKNRWFEYDGKQKEFILTEDGGSSSTPWRTSDEHLSGLEVKIMDQIVSRKINEENLDNYVFTISILRGERPTESIKTDSSWEHRFKGFLINLVPLY